VNRSPASRRRPRSLERRWAERKLFFWTARQALALVVLVVLTLYLIVSLLSGELGGLEQLIKLVAVAAARVD
jgi:hypothetical protein